MSKLQNGNFPVPVNRPKSEVEKKEFIRAWNQNPLAELFGFTLNISDMDAPVFEIPEIKIWQRGGQGTMAVNGGIIAAMCDYAIGIAGLLNLPDGPKGTVDLNIFYAKPLHGNKIRVVAQIERKGSIMVASTANVYDENDQVCATARGRVLMVLDQ